jgi:hypothetical protein
MLNVMFLVFFVLVVGSEVIAQDNRHVPAEVQRSFHKDYPEASDPKWSCTNGQWHAAFNDHSQSDRGEMVANYDRSGHHIDSHIPYDQDDTPPPVVYRTQRNYPGASNYSYTRIERPAGNPLFRVDMNLQNKNRTLYEDENGNVQKYDDRH